jgi:hypothetical protein
MNVMAITSAKGRRVATDQEPPVACLSARFTGSSLQPRGDRGICLAIGPYCQAPRTDHLASFAGGKELETPGILASASPKGRKRKRPAKALSLNEGMDTHLPAAPLACDGLLPPTPYSPGP